MKKLIIIIIFCISYLQSNAQEFLAKMKISVECNGLIFSQDESIVVFKPFESLKKWAVWKSNGESCDLDTLAFQVIPDKAIFKIETNCFKLLSNSCNEHIKEEFKFLNIDYCSIIQRIIRKDKKALTEFFDLIPKVDASLSEIHSSVTWPLINSLTDSELSSWLKRLDEARLRQFVNYLKNESVAYPITRYAEYLSLYYPRSYTILKKII
jgi:hypothetical protein